MVVLSSSISAKASKMSRHECKGYKCSAPQHSHPHNNTMSRNEKFWVEQVTVPHPPLGYDKGWGTTRAGGGGGYAIPRNSQNRGNTDCGCKGKG